MPLRTYDDHTREWLLKERPPLGEVIEKLAEARAILRQVRLVEAHLVGYAMEELLGLDYQLDDMPDVLKDPVDWTDE